MFRLENDRDGGVLARAGAEGRAEGEAAGLEDEQCDIFLSADDDLYRLFCIN